MWRALPATTLAFLFLWSHVQPPSFFLGLWIEWFYFIIRKEKWTYCNLSSTFLLLVLHIVYNLVIHSSGEHFQQLLFCFVFFLISYHTYSISCINFGYHVWVEWLCSINGFQLVDVILAICHLGSSWWLWSSYLISRPSGEHFSITRV